MSTNAGWRDQSNVAEILQPGRLWSLWDMLKLNASDFVQTVSIIGRVRALIEADIESGKKEKFDGSLKDRAIGHLDNLIEVMQPLDLPLTEKSVERMKRTLERTDMESAEAERRYRDIEDRMLDELNLVGIFSISREKVRLYDPEQPLFGEQVNKKFRSAQFEIDEAGKCLAVRRPTACVFHLMRVMEVGIRSVARCLNIPDPTKGGDKNWGKILKKIKDEIDKRSTTKTWNKTKDQEFFSACHAHLDVVREAWRNTTMHVENKYTEEEAEDIFAAVRSFMRKLATRLSETGKPLA